MERKLRVTFILVLLYILLYKLLLLKYPAPFSFMFTLGDVFYNLLIGYCSSYIFYMIFNHHQREKEKKLLKLVVNKPLTYVVSNIEAPINHLSKKVLGDNIDINNLTKENFNNICRNIKLFDVAPGATETNGKLVSINYFSYLNEYVNIVNKSCKEILDFTKVLDDELILLINSIKTSSYHELIIVNYKAIGVLRNTSFDFLSNEMFDYYNLYKSLKKYALKNKLIDSEKD